MGSSVAVTRDFNKSNFSHVDLYQLVHRSEPPNVQHEDYRPHYKFMLINSLTTVGYLLEVFIRLWIPSMVRIFTSAWSWQWKLETRLY